VPKSLELRISVQNEGTMTEATQDIKKPSSVDEAAKEAEAKLLAMISPTKKKEELRSPKEDEKEQENNAPEPAQETTNPLADGDDPFAGLSNDPEGAKVTGDQTLLKSFENFEVKDEAEEKKAGMEMLEKLGYSPSRATSGKIDFAAIKSSSGKLLNEEEAKKELAEIFG
jgi:hypothetical protein